MGFKFIEPIFRFIFLPLLGGRSHMGSCKCFVYVQEITKFLFCILIWNLPECLWLGKASPSFLYVVNMDVALKACRRILTNHGSHHRNHNKDSHIIYYCEWNTDFYLGFTRDGKWTKETLSIRTPHIIMPWIFKIKNLYKTFFILTFFVYYFFLKINTYVGTLNVYVSNQRENFQNFYYHRLVT